MLVSVKESKCQVALAKLINSPQHTRNLAICVNRCEYIDYTYPLEVIKEANLIKVRLDIISNLLESALIL